MFVSVFVIQEDIFWMKVILQVTSYMNFNIFNCMINVMVAW